MKDTRITIKLAKELYDKLKARAEKNHRTITGEIASLLESPTKLPLKGRVI